MRRRQSRPKGPSPAEIKAAQEAAQKAKAEAREVELCKAADQYEIDVEAETQKAAQGAKLHFLTAIIPIMTESELDSLALDIKRNGQLRPIIYDADGVLVDGKCRLAACRRAGIEPKSITLKPREDAFEVSWRENFLRSHYTLSVSAMAIAVGLPQQSLSELVETSGYSRTRMYQAMYVRDHGAESVIGMVMQGLTPLDKAYDETRERIREAELHQKLIEELQKTEPDLWEMVREERMTLEAALQEFQRRKAKRDELQAAKARVKVLEEIADK